MLLNEWEQKHEEMEKEKHEMGWERFQGWRPEAERCRWGQSWEGEEVTWQLEGVRSFWEVI